jgi:hypothetical protein
MRLYHLAVETSDGEESLEFAVRAASERAAEDAAWAYATEKFHWIDFESIDHFGEVETVPAGATAIDA